MDPGLLVLGSSNWFGSVRATQGALPCMGGEVNHAWKLCLGVSMGNVFMVAEC